MQRGSIEHEQIIYESSNSRMKQLMDWLSNSHWTPDTGMTLFAGQQKGHPSRWHGLPLRRGRSSWRVRAGSKAGVLACWIRGNKHLTIGARRHKCASFAFKSDVRVYRRPSQVQLMRGEFLETALYWAGVISVRLGAIAEKKVSQHSCVRPSGWVWQPTHNQLGARLHT